ncbi:ROK family protein [Vibrio fortis]|uniref:ROK family protein n=1 Tax=Vibrio fortis TaxID=212667 RepID=A0A5N3R0R5_9VIBR|nr:ROK family protein [Vibrio fortis]KAB0288064.1 ROK family protein [Vibrio fortis]
MSDSVVMGISIDPQSIHSVTNTSSGREVYRNVQNCPDDLTKLSERLKQLVSSNVWRFGKVTTVVISVCEHLQTFSNGRNSRLSQVNAAQLAIDLSNHFGFDCSVVSTSQAGLASDCNILDVDNSSVLSLSLDIGCSLSFYKNGKWSAQSLCRHWAHSPLPDFQWLIDGLTPVCRCGREACIEQFLSIEGIERQYHQVVLQDRSLADIFSGVEEGDIHSTRIYRAFIDQLARSLLSPIEELAPKQLVLSGFATTYPSLNKELRVALSRYHSSDSLPVISQNSQDSFVFAYGAALMAIKNNNNHLRS